MIPEGSCFAAQCGVWTDLIYRCTVYNCLLCFITQQFQDETNEGVMIDIVLHYASAERGGNKLTGIPAPDNHPYNKSPFIPKVRALY